MSHAFRRSLSILLASILCIAPLAAVAATSPLPSLGDADIASAKLQAVYRQADIALDKAIAKAGPNLTTRERWVLTQALAAIEKRFEAIDRALTARDAQAFKSEVSSFKKEYSTIAGFLKTASSRTSTATVDVEPVKPTTSTQTTATATPVTVPIARTIALGRDIFAGLGVKLDTGIPSEYLRGETLHISGIIETADAASLIFLLAPDKQTRFIASLPAENGKFSYSVPLREVGSYSLVIAAGKSFETRNLATITVTDPVAEAAGLPTSSISDVSSFSFERVNFTDLSGVNLMTFDKSDPKTLYTVVVTDSSGHSVTRRGMGSVAFFWDDFTDFEINKPVQVRVTARASVSTSSTDAYTASKVVFNRSMTLSPSYAAKNEIGFDVRTKGNSTVEIVGTTPSDGRTLARELYVIRPDGSVDTKLFDLHVANSADTEVLKTGTEIAYSFDARDE